MVGLVWLVWFGLVGLVWLVCFGRFGLVGLVWYVWFSDPPVVTTYSWITCSCRYYLEHPKVLLKQLLEHNVLH